MSEAYFLSIAVLVIIAVVNDMSIFYTSGKKAAPITK